MNHYTILTQDQLQATYLDTIAALEAENAQLRGRVGRLVESADEMIAFLEAEDGKVRWHYGPASYVMERLLLAAHPDLDPTGGDDAK